MQLDFQGSLKPLTKGSTQNVPLKTIQPVHRQEETSTKGHRNSPVDTDKTAAPEMPVHAQRPVREDGMVDPIGSAVVEEGLRIGRSKLEFETV